MKTEVKEIPFNGDKLLGVKTEDGRLWLAIRAACTDIGLSEKQADNNVKKIKDSLLFNGSWKELSLKFKGQVRTITVLSEKFVPMWLAQINLTPIMREKNPIAIQKLLKYQLEATDVLHKAFYETEEQKSFLHTELGINGKITEIQETMKIQSVQINNMETMLEDQSELLSSVMDNMTIGTRQQEKILKAARERVNCLLGGAHSDIYKKMGRTYLSNLWNNFKSSLHCGSSYKDLNPKDFNKALDFISEWEYVR